MQGRIEQSVGRGTGPVTTPGARRQARRRWRWRWVMAGGGTPAGSGNWTSIPQTLRARNGAACAAHRRGRCLLARCLLDTPTHWSTGPGAAGPGENLVRGLSAECDAPRNGRYHDRTGDAPCTRYSSIRIHVPDWWLVTLPRATAKGRARLALCRATEQESTLDHGNGSPPLAVSQLFQPSAKLRFGLAACEQAEKPRAAQHGSDNDTVPSPACLSVSRLMSSCPTCASAISITLSVEQRAVCRA